MWYLFCLLVTSGYIISTCLSSSSWYCRKRQGEFVQTGQCHSSSAGGSSFSSFGRSSGTCSSRTGGVGYSLSGKAPAHWSHGSFDSSLYSCLSSLKSSFFSFPHHLVGPTGDGVQMTSFSIFFARGVQVWWEGPQAYLLVKVPMEGAESRSGDSQL